MKLPRGAIQLRQRHGMACPACLVSPGPPQSLDNRGDQGWHEVGAYPAYYIDCLPGFSVFGRGSPYLGDFFTSTRNFRGGITMHISFAIMLEARIETIPIRDHRRLVAFFLKTKKAASWDASVETPGPPRNQGREIALGKLTQFCVVDVDGRA